MVSRDRAVAMLDEAKLVYCCTRNFKDGLRSGLCGTLQQHGWTEANRTSLVKAFEASVKVLIELDGTVSHYPEIKDSALGLRIFSGLFHMIKVFGVASENRNTCKEVLEEVRTKELATIGETLAARCKHDKQEEEKDAGAAYKKALEDEFKASSSQGGPFGGTGDHIEGMWTFGSCTHPG